MTAARWFSAPLTRRFGSIRISPPSRPSSYCGLLRLALRPLTARRWTARWVLFAIKVHRVTMPVKCRRMPETSRAPL